MSAKKHTLTPEQLALSEERKRRKAQAAAIAAASSGDSPGCQKKLILHRTWLTRSSASGEHFTPTEQTTIMTWNVGETSKSDILNDANMLAQCLVRRELFPTSDCLKASQREGMTLEEVVKSGADIICLQEVDRLGKLVLALEAANYSHTYTSGPRKKHGCLIAYRNNLYAKTESHTVFYDEEKVRDSEAEDHSQYGSSFKTRNIALIVGLKRLDAENENIVVATTHLFWHPKYTYERARQAYILVRSVNAFKEKHGLQTAPSLIVGDFNFDPANAAYSLLAGDTLLPNQEEDILASRVVHVSLDPSVPVADKKLAAAEEEGGEEADPENDPDRVIKNARRATEKDGLLLPGELAELCARGTAGLTLRSAYDAWGSFDENRMFGTRAEKPMNRRGHSEPIYTSYTHFWKVTLDYIFVLLPPGRTLKVLGILEPPAADQLGPGLPQKGICGSDHISLRAHIAWPKE